MEAALPATVQVAIIAADRFDPVPNEWVLYDWLARINRHTVTPSHANHASKYSTCTYCICRVNQSQPTQPRVKLLAKTRDNSSWPSLTEPDRRSEVIHRWCQSREWNCRLLQQKKGKYDDSSGGIFVDVCAHGKASFQQKAEATNDKMTISSSSR